MGGISLGSKGSTGSGSGYLGPYSALTDGTAVKANQQATAPDGSLVAALADFTKTGAFNAGQWRTIGGRGAQVDKPGVYVPANAFPALGPALQNAGSQLVEVVYFGDSTGFGSGGDGGPVRKVRSLAVAAGVADGGRGIASPNETSSASGESLAPLVSKTGFGASGGTNDFLNSDTPVSAAASDVITYTGKGTAIRIYYRIWQGQTGRFQYAVDGGAPVVVDASTASDGATTATVGVIYVGGLSEGTHTVVVTNLGNVSINAPGTAPVVSGSNTGGTLAAGSYFYKTTAVTGSGETTPSPASGGTGTAGGAGSMTVTPFRVPGATSYNVYRATSSGGAYVLVGNVADSGAGGFNSTTVIDTGGAGGAAPPATNTAGFTGTTKQCAVVCDFIRATGVVFHKQAISGISTTSYFAPSRSVTATQPNAMAQMALGLQTGIGGTPAVDWNRQPATKPNTRRVRAAIFALGINDADTTSEANFQTSLANSLEGFGLFVKMCRAAGADPILVVPHYEYAAITPMAGFYSRLRSGVVSMARALGVPYVDYNVALGPVNAGPYSGAPHLSQAAYDSEGSFLWNEMLSKVYSGALV